MSKKIKKPMADDQAKAFRKAARDLGCDDNEERFKDALRTVATAKPAPVKSKKSRR
jgi:hypothetical protein